MHLDLPRLKYGDWFLRFENGEFIKYINFKDNLEAAKKIAANNPHYVLFRNGYTKDRYGNFFCL